MYYHCSLLLLFRPFLKATFTRNIDVTPREVCRQAANNISEIWSRHLAMYGLAGIYTFQVHCLFTACTIHIINLPTIAATNHFVQACNTLQKLIPRNDWAKSALTILRGLVEKWELILPQDAEEALYRAFDEGGDKFGSASEQGHHSEHGAADNSHGGKPQGQSVPRTGSAATHSSHGNRYDEPQSATTNSSGSHSQWPPLHHSTSSTETSLPMMKRPHFPPLQLQQSSGGTAPAPSQQGGPNPNNAQSYLYVPSGGRPILEPVDVSGEGGINKALRRDAEMGGELGGLESGVEGLQFGDDWRDPFMGYLGPQR